VAVMVPDVKVWGDRNVQCRTAGFAKPGVL
jgi:hypothetical protein